MVRLPGGVSRFQYPGRARPQARYTTPAALFFFARPSACRLAEHLIFLEPTLHLAPRILGRFLAIARAIVGVKAMRRAGEPHSAGNAYAKQITCERAGSKRGGNHETRSKKARGDVPRAFLFQA